MMNQSIFRGTTFFLVILLSLFFISCKAETEEDEIPDYDISQLYGYTFSGTINASSGSTLTPELTIFDSSHVEWNMSSSSMAAYTYYYSAKKSTQNVYYLYWYSSKSELSTNDTSKAQMTVTLGINDTKNISVIGMGSTVVEMSRISDEQRTFEESKTDTSIDIPSITVAGSSAEWISEESAYTGKLHIIVMGADYANGENHSITITKTGENTVSITNPTLQTSMMNMESFTLENVEVTKDGEIYYLSASNFTAMAGNVTLKVSSLKGKLENGILSLVYVYKPGKMPLDITQVFVSSKN